MLKDFMANAPVVKFCENNIVTFDSPELMDQWISKLDGRVKWFICGLALYRSVQLDGKGIVITSIMGERDSHKDGFAADSRTWDMSRKNRLVLRSVAFQMRRDTQKLTKKEGWRFGFEPHDNYEKHDPPWHNEHFHNFVKEV